MEWDNAKNERDFTKIRVEKEITLRVKKINETLSVTPHLYS